MSAAIFLWPCVCNSKNVSHTDPPQFFFSKVRVRSIQAVTSFVIAALCPFKLLYVSLSSLMSITISLKKKKKRACDVFLSYKCVLKVSALDVQAFFCTYFVVSLTRTSVGVFEKDHTDGSNGTTLFKQ